MIDLALLGSGGGMPTPHRFLSALLINYQGRKILIDCGEGTQVSMKILRWGFKSIDIIAITHSHGDHIVGLPGLLATMGNSGRTEPVYLIGPKGIKDVIKGLRVIVPYIPYELYILEDPKQELKFNVRDGRLILKDEYQESLTFKDYEEGDMNLSTLSLDHSSPCLGYCLNINRRSKFDMEKALLNKVPKVLWNKLQKGGRIEYEGMVYEPSMVLGRKRKGIKISYITDTRPIDSIVEFVYKSRLFICEGTYGEDKDIEKAVNNKHMTFKEAGELAMRAQVKELLLTHFSPSMQNPEEFLFNATSVFTNTIIGRDRMVKTLSFED